ncbi:phosphoesterase family-domain-containing protein [Polychytrium aggregatum]|uniref:phosphoesterase family-domain-containing protein n=1 Tax=Polychytrium aggregatum TaxID=110093 RepID=UPI0022FE8B68|nr:phosphoesterase family-domain-containing protein [Polychytrium aggregatum]KAI9202971.1 phosphoesterase family-domain-containing protein [Polychytrium aggregatum]
MNSPVVCSAALLLVIARLAAAISYTITNPLPCIRPGDLIKVSWTGSSSVNSLDWIGIYADGRCTNAVGGSCPSGSNAWQRVVLTSPNTAKNGIVTVAAPAAGTYRAYYLLNDQYQIGAFSAAFKVDPSCPASYTLGSVPACIAPQTAISVPWSTQAPAGSMDWIGLYKSGRCSTTCPSGSDAWARISTASPNNATQGVLNIVVPAETNPPSSYMAYYLINDLYTIGAVSESFTVSSSCTPITPVTLTTTVSSVVAGGFLTISWSGANVNDADDRIMFTSSGVPSSTNFLDDAWQYTYGDQTATGAHPPASGSVSIKAPATPGVYTAYYCINNGFRCIGSVNVTVTAPNVQCRASGQTASSIKNLIVVISENHSFDSYYGHYCQAPAGSNPSCNTGRSCCAAASTVSGVSATVLNDASNLAFDPCHSYACEICEINNGAMDKYIGSGGCPGSSNSNYAIADGSSTGASQYWQWASEYAIADRFFQSAPGASSQSDMYFARGAWVFQDNTYVPDIAWCSSSIRMYNDPTVADLLVGCNVGFRFYAEGYNAPRVAGQCWPQYFDPSDVPFLYYNSLAHSSQSSSYFQDFTNFASDVASGSLPAVTFVKPLGTRCEHPGTSSITAGENFSQGIIDTIMNSSIYSENTLIILVPDESGGFRDSVAPPPRSVVDNKPYGPRTPFVVIGAAANKNFISHVPMEPASIIRFIESNWLGGSPGQLQTRDAVVNNIGSLLNITVTGYNFP